MQYTKLGFKVVFVVLREELGELALLYNYHGYHFLTTITESF